jgi:integrase
MLADAVDDGIIPANPANGLRGRKGLDKSSATERQQRIRPMSRETLAAFLDIAKRGRELKEGAKDNRSDKTRETEKRRDQRDYPLFLTMADAGLRPGEALALRWEDIDLADRTVFVERAVSEGGVKATKTGTSRTVDLTRRLADTLSRWQATCEADALVEGPGTLPRGCSPPRLAPRSTTRVWRVGSALCSYGPSFPSASLIGWSRRVRPLTQDRRKRLGSLPGCLRSSRNFWSRGRELNPRPTDYEEPGTSRSD